MTSNSALSQFADLSPQQRQLLFEKIRQKKLSNARRPLEDAFAPIATDVISLSPHQRSLLELDTFAQATNRVIEINFESQLGLPQLQQAIDQLSQVNPLLCSRFDHQQKQFLINDLSTTATLSELVGMPESQHEEAIAHTRDKLARQPNDRQCLHVTLIKCSEQKQRLLLAMHPLLLDSYSLLRLANQLLSYTENPMAFEAAIQSEPGSQHRFANWSAQMLEQKFLQDEWHRLAPKMMTTESSSITAISKVATSSTQIASDFIDSHAPRDVSVKQWLCNALNQCLYSWLSHHEITYWFSDPLLKDSEFENLLGFFPYYVPVKGQPDDVFDITRTLANLHTRYSAVSEHLGRALCSSGSQIPLIHYHWFDVENHQGESVKLASVQHHNNGFMLSPFEIHIIEHGAGLNLDIHFDPDRINSKQLNLLTNDLKALLRQDNTTDSANTNSLPEQLRAIWRDLLQINSIEPDQSFFELGGHSLQVTELKFRIKQQLKLDIPISVLYELTTIEKLSSFILATHGNSLGWLPDAEGQEEEEEGTL
ncbi:acyl carrier protein [Ketobacter sp.]